MSKKKIRKPQKPKQPYSLSFIPGRGWRAQVKKPDGSWTSKWLPQHLTVVQGLEAQQWIMGWYSDWIKSWGTADPKVVVAAKKTLTLLIPKWLELRYQSNATSTNYYHGLWQSATHWILDHASFSHHSIQELDCESEFTVEQITKWINSLQGSFSTKLVHVTALRAFFRDAISQEWLNPEMISPLDKPAIKKLCKELGKARKDEQVNSYLLQGQSTALLTEPHPKLTDYRRVRYTTALATGAREAEIQALTWGDVDFATMSLTITKQLVHGGPTPMLQEEELLKNMGKAELAGVSNALVKRPKFNSKREVPLHPLLIAVLKVWKKTGWKAYAGRSPCDADPIFPRENRSLRDNQKGGDFCMSESAVLLRTDLVRVGQADTFQGEPLVFHSLRHSFSSYLDAAGVDDAKISFLMGHAPRTTVRSNYIGKNLEAYRAIIEKLPLPDHVLLSDQKVRPETDQPVQVGLRLIKSL